MGGERGRERPGRLPRANEWTGAAYRPVRSTVYDMYVVMIYVHGMYSVQQKRQKVGGEKGGGGGGGEVGFGTTNQTNLFM